MRKLMIVISVVFIGVIVTTAILWFANEEEPLPEYCEFCYIVCAGCFDTEYRYTVFSIDHKYYMTIKYRGSYATYEITKDQYRECIPNVDDLKRVIGTDSNPHCTVLLEFHNEAKKLYEYKDGIKSFEQFEKYKNVFRSIRRNNTDDDSERIVMAMTEIFKEYDVTNYLTTANNNSIQKQNEDNYYDEDWSESFEKMKHQFAAEYANVYLFRKGMVSFPYLGNNTKIIELMYEKNNGNSMDILAQWRNVSEWPMNLYYGKLSSYYELLMLRYYTIFPKGIHLVYTKLLSANDWVRVYYTCPQERMKIYAEYKITDPISRVGLELATLRVNLTNGRISAIPGESIGCHIMFFGATADMIIGTVFIIFTILKRHKDTDRNK